MTVPVAKWFWRTLFGRLANPILLAFGERRSDWQQTDCGDIRSAWDPECAELCSVVTQCCPSDGGRLIDMIDDQIPLDHPGDVPPLSAPHPSNDVPTVKQGIDGSD